MSEASVALVACGSYDQSEVDSAVSRSLDLLGGIDRFVGSGDRVLLKCNLLVGAAPERAITTHPAILRAVAREVRAAGGVPVAGDCGAFEGPPNMNRFISGCATAGIKQVCDEEDVELVHLSRASVEVASPHGVAFKRFLLAEEVVRADAVISLPKLKTHGLTLFTGGVKNLFGCLPGLTKMQMHARAQGIEAFSQMLVDLMVAIRPTLTVMDAVIGMDGNGPRNGQPKQIGAVLASVDPVALDSVACRLVGLDPFLVPTTRLADVQGAGVAAPERISVLGDDLESVRVEGFRLASGPEAYFRARGVWKLLQKRLTAKPIIASDRCTACWTCIRHCPVGAMSQDARKPTLDYERCIRCYCCQELCPSDAVELRRPILAHLIR